MCDIRPDRASKLQASRQTLSKWSTSKLPSPFSSAIFIPLLGATKNWKFPISLNVATMRYRRSSSFNYEISDPQLRVFQFSPPLREEENITRSNTIESEWEKWKIAVILVPLNLRVVSRTIFLLAHVLFNICRAVAARFPRVRNYPWRKLRGRMV